LESDIVSDSGLMGLGTTGVPFVLAYFVFILRVMDTEQLSLAELAGQDAREKHLNSIGKGEMPMNTILLVSWLLVLSVSYRCALIVLNKADLL
jgi:hypothetical protein